MANLIRNLLVFFKKHIQLADAYSEISVSELVGYVEPQSTKLSPLQSHSMEQTQREEQLLEHISLCF